MRLRAPGWDPPLYVGVGGDHALRLVPRSSAALFDVAPLTQLKGANLGSWLIPEKACMRPTLNLTLTLTPSPNPNPNPKP